MINNELNLICGSLGISEPIEEAKQVKNGLINTTYLVKTFDGKKYMVQKINTFVFKKPDELMENISRVTHFLRKRIKESGADPERETLRFLKTKDGKSYLTLENGSTWRAYVYMDNSFTVNETEDLEVFKSAGKAFGRFMKRLNSFPVKELHETIEDFHNTPKRYSDFLESVERDEAGRKSTCLEEIRFVTERCEDMNTLMRLYKDGKIPTRVTHNDTKLNNVLFDDRTKEAFCVIDLDTVMPGMSLYDFGDSMRSGANSAKEDEADLDKVFLNLDLFRSYTEGYLSETAHCLTQTEIDCLPFSVKLMTLECGMRFLKDYLDGDKYFRIEYPEHNLVRARNQFKLVSDTESKMDEMTKIVRNIVSKM
ncbi:MAG: aminoglycoside phosphotransferase family protein [Oscillospiraceae bacterium]|nr:aminoglycoside phosphotransferase family protein [Oscillospiraceae bacterium]